ncbi:MAG TPA: MBL fold metallo-hydrolase, partial [Cellvibrionales bacterium]|nr:MBL fold metallo-hydrolase [Cellvibrionales bacterium]
VVAHISQQNNTEALALDALQNVFPYHERILVADQDTGFDWLQIS